MVATPGSHREPDDAADNGQVTLGPRHAKDSYMKTLRALTAPTAVVAVAFLLASLLASLLSSGTSRADATSVYPGMEIIQGSHLCTLGYIDPVLRIAFTAGHCRGGEGAVTDGQRAVIGHMAAFRDSTPSGTIVTSDQQISDYEAIVLDSNVAINDVLPGGRQLTSAPTVALSPGQAVCHFGVSTGETCGTVESINNGWFTMSHGVLSRNGDSGGPVYLAPANGPGQLVGIFNSMWGDFPAAVSWPAASAQVHEDLQAPNAVPPGQLSPQSPSQPA